MARIFISEEAEIAKTTLEPSPIHHSLGMATCRESEPGFPAANTERRTWTCHQIIWKNLHGITARVTMFWRAPLPLTSSSIIRIWSGLLAAEGPPLPLVFHHPILYCSCVWCLRNGPATAELRSWNWYDLSWNAEPQIIELISC